jgi:NDP-sugar pyrophosphorylase family protein
MQVVIPAGGRGLRLRPITNYHPKPLLPLGDRPILSHILQGIPPEFPVTVVVTAELEAEFRAWQESVSPARDVRIFVERSVPGCRPGPVSAVVQVLRETGVQDDLVLLMGDSVLPFTMRDFLPANGQCRMRLAAYELPEIEQASRFGVLGIAETGMMASFAEKPQRPESPWVFTGCLYIPAPLLPALLAFGDHCSPEMGQIVAQFHALGEEIEVFRAGGEWHDIGTFRSYLAAHQSLPTASDRDRLRQGGSESSGCVYVDPRARITRSRLENCLIFGDAEITDACLTDCIVWPRVRVTGRTAERTLFAPDGEQPIQVGG